MHQQNLQSLYDYLREAAVEALTGSLSFAPFGAAIRQSGEKTHLAADLLPQTSVPEDHIAGIIAALRQEDQSVGLIAAGLVFDTQLQSEAGPVAALGFHIEVSNGDALQIFQAYQRPDGVAVVLSAPELQPVYPEIFAAPA